MSWRERAIPLDIQPNAAVSAASSWRSRAQAISVTEPEPVAMPEPVEPIAPFAVAVPAMAPTPSETTIVQPPAVADQKNWDAAAAAQPQPTHGFASGFKAAVQNYPDSFGQGITAIGDVSGNENAQKVGEYISEKKSEPAVQPLKWDNINGVGDGIDWLQEQIGSGLGSTVPTILSGMIGGYAGGKIGSVGGKRGEQLGTAAGSIVGVSSLAVPSNIGDIRADLIDNGLSPEEASKWAVPAGSILSIPDVASGNFLLSKLGFTRKPKDEMRKALVVGILRKYADGQIKDAATMLTKQMGKDALEGGLAEGATELAQQAGQIGVVSYAADKPVATMENLEELVSAGVGGFGGGGIAGASAVPVNTGVFYNDLRKEWKRRNPQDTGYTEQGPTPEMKDVTPPSDGSGGTGAPNISFIDEAVTLPNGAMPEEVTPPAPNRDVLAAALSGDEEAAAQLQTAAATPAPATPQVGDTIEQTIPNGPTIRGTIQQITRTGETTTYAVYDGQDQEPTFVYDTDGDIQVVGQGQTYHQPAPTPPSPTRDTLAADLSPAPDLIQRSPTPAPVEPAPVSTQDRLAAMSQDELIGEYQSGHVQRRGLAKAELDRRFPGYDAPRALDVASAISDVNQTPTEGQKEAGNYQKGHVKLHGLDISIENPAGSKRSGTDAAGTPWSVDMPAHYGYIKRTEGADGDHVDVYVGNQLDSDIVYVVDQIDPATGDFDEHKLMLGFGNPRAAYDTYLKAFSDGKGNDRIGKVTAMKMPEFKQWLKEGDTSKPISYKKPAPAPQPEPAPAPQALQVTPAAPQVIPATPQTVAQAPQTSSIDSDPTGFKGMTGENGMAAAIGGNLRTMLYQKFAMGSINENGQPSVFLQVAKAIKDAGGNVTRPVFNNILNDVQAVKDSGVTGPAYQDAMRGIIANYAPARAPEAPSKPAEAPSKAPEPTTQRQVDLPRVPLMERAEKRAAELTPNKPPFGEKLTAADVWWHDLSTETKKELMAKAEVGPDVFPLSLWKHISPQEQLRIFMAAETVPLKLREEPRGNAAANAPQPAPAPTVKENETVQPVSNADVLPMPDENDPFFKEKNIIRQLRNSANNDYQASGEPHTAGSRKALRDQADAMQVQVARKELDGKNVVELPKPQQESKSVSNETPESPARVQPVAEPSTRPLEGVSAPEVRPTQEGGNTESGSVQSGRPDVAADAGNDVRGSDVGRGVGSEPRAVSPDTAGTGDQRGTDAGEPSVPSQPTDGGRLAETGRDTGVIVPDDNNYTITAEDRLGEGGQAEKYRDNIAAIKLYRELQKANRQATPEEQAVLVRYVGWGGIKAVFGNSVGEYAKGWETKGAELKELLTGTEYADARESVLNAHFTSEPIVRGMYDIVNRLGFTGGAVLEPSMGTGNFFGLMPASVRSTSQLTGVELDTLTGGIAKQLYPGFNVLAPVGFQEAPLADNHFDLVIGNPPFGSEKVPGAREKDIGDFSIHNYFFARSINKLRPGGIMVMIVTSRFLDKASDKQRQWLAERAELVGAIRMPNTAFQQNALTEVTTDIIVMRKLEAAQQGKADTSWTQVSSIPDPLGGDDIAISSYFVGNPDMLLGRMERSGSMYRGDNATLADDGRDLSKSFADAISKLPEGLYKPTTTILSAEDMRRAAAKPLDAASAYAVGSYFTDDGRIMQRQESPDGQPVAVEITPSTQWSEKQALGEKRFEKLKGIVEIRDAARSVLRLEASDANDLEVSRARNRLNVVYDKFQAEHGYLNDTTNERVFASDPDAPLMLALENDYDPGVSSAKAKALGIKSKKPTASKMTIFRQRVIPKWEPVTTADNAADALSITLSERGQVDMSHMAKLTGKTEEELANELSYEAEKPLIFKNPETDEWETDSVYLSGNVKQKEAIARKRGAIVQADALKAMFPADVSAGDIKIRVGASWVDGKYYADFIKHMLGEDTVAKVVYLPSSGGFHVEVSGGLQTNVYQKWGTNRVGANDLIDKILNNRDMVVKDKQPDGSYVVNKEETLAANTKADEIKEEFGEWIMKDAERRGALTAYYNDKLNTNVEPTFDGSHMKFPGMNPTKSMRRHQKNAVWRSIQQRRTLLDHVVGSGKTFTIASTAMELRRTGLAKKPMIAVPNHLVQQWAKEFYALYPGAKLLTMNKKDFEKKNRRRMLARIATGDFDAIIIAHSSYGFIPVSKEAETKFIENQMFEIQSSIDAVRQAEGRGGRRVADLERSKKNLEARLKKLAAKPKDDMLTWEELGVDQLFVDESHEFKNLYFTTGRRGVLGLGNPKGSQKAFDMFIKTQQVLEGQNRKGVIFATGTPISNSLSEMYTLQRYMGMSDLQCLNILSFDAWMNNFGDDYVDYELDGTAQKYKQVTRLRGLTNLPELMKFYKQFTDSVTNEQVKQAYREDNPGKEFPIPRVVGGKNRFNVVVPRSDEQADYFEEIVERASNLQPGGKDNMLNITTDARKAALDIRLVDPSASDNPEGKTNIAANDIASIYRQWESDRGTQLVFLDLSIPLSAAKNEGAKLREAMAEINEVQRSIEAMEERGGYGSVKGMTLENLEDKLEALEEDMNRRFSQDDIMAVQSAERGFSVYDDMRQKLIDRGVKAEEIAFIHDWNTDQKKAELFDLVNAGKIRVLFGSTTKMGAGTNVQQRLVALHHIDCPWRPSDIEQREGRIVRQGNALLEKYGMDKFEVKISLYATEKTYDARMWQTQEQKLLGIEGLRNYNGSREMEEVAAASASAAEMKAAATGNPLVLEDVRLSESLRRLDIAKKAFQRKEYDLQDDLKRYTNVIETYPDRITNFKADAERFAPYMEDPFGGNPPTGTVAGKEYTSAEAALEAISAEVERQNPKDAEGKTVKSKSTYEVDVDGQIYTSQEGYLGAVTKIWGDAKPIQIEIDGTTYRSRGEAAKAIISKVGEDIQGNLGGFPFTISVDVGAKNEGTLLNTSIVYSATIKGTGKSYDVETRQFGDEKGTTAARSLFNHMITALAAAGDNAASLERHLEQSKKELEAVKSEVGKPFPKEEELRTNRERLNQVRKELAGTSQQGEPTMPVETGAPKMSLTSKKKARSETLQAVEKAIASQLAKVGWPDLQVVIAPEVKVEDVENTVAGAYWNKVVYLSMKEDPIGTLNHEMLHALREVGAFTDAEWAQLTERAAVWRKKYGVDEKYGPLGLSEDQMNEEAFAAAFQDHATQGPIRRIINRIMRFIRAIKDSLTTGRFSFATAEDVFDSILAGKVAPRRDADTETTEGIKPNLSARERRIMYALGTAPTPKEALEEAAEAMDISENVNGYYNGMPKDLMALSAYLNHPRHIARVFRPFAKVYQTANEMQEYHDELVHQLHTSLTPYTSLDAKSKERVNAVLEIGVLGALDTFTPFPDGTIVARNNDLEKAILSEVGEEFVLTAREAEGYLAARGTMDAIAELERVEWLDSHGMLEKGITNARELKKAIVETESETEREKMVFVLKVLEEIENSKKRGYVPLTRWGEVGVVVKKIDEKTPKMDWDLEWFEKIETQTVIDRVQKLAKGNPSAIGEQPAVKRALESLRSKFPADKYEITVFPVKAFADLQDKVSIRDIGILAANSELQPEEYMIFLNALEAATRKRGERAHFLRSNNVPGYSPDLERSMSARVISAAGFLSRSKFNRQFDSTIRQMAERNVLPALLKYSQRYIKAVNDPVEQARLLRQFVFLDAIVGRTITALVNATQTTVTTLPILGGINGFGKATVALGKGYADARKMFTFHKGLDLFDPTKAPADIAAAMEQAWARGIFVPRDTFDIMARASTSLVSMRGLSKKVRTAFEAAGIMFSGVERLNRISSFVAAHRLASDPKNVPAIFTFLRGDQYARETVIKGKRSAQSLIVNGKVDPEFLFEYAQYISDLTQFKVGKVNRAEAARSYIGSLVFQLKSFVMQMMETMYSLVRYHGKAGLKAFAAILFALWMWAGVQGIPGIKTLESIGGTIYTMSTGRDVDVVTEARKFIANDLGLGKRTASVFLDGPMSNLLNIDLTSRIGMGELLPRGTLQDVLGPFVSMTANKVKNTANDVARGDTTLAIADAMPFQALADVVRAYDLATEGAKARSGVGKTLVGPEDISNFTIGLRALGGQSLDLRLEKDAQYAIKKAENSASALKSSYISTLIGDMARAERAREKGDMDGYNKYNAAVEATYAEIERYNQGRSPDGMIDIYSKKFGKSMQKKLQEELEGFKSHRTKKNALDDEEAIRNAFGRK